MTVEILLATFQGEKYLREQLESLFNQSYPDIRILVRDDGSTDRTPEILKEYGDRIKIIPNTINSGIRNNFSELLKLSTADYVFFSDQDDIWLTDKVTETIQKLKEMERQFGASTPLLVHSDLKVVDRDLKVISPSFCKYAKLKPRYNTLNRLLVQNNITGCTIGMNRTLAAMSRPIPDEAIMHDWWIALTAACFGQISFIPFATILYRQHESNDVGAKRNNLAAYMSQSPKELNKKASCEQQTFDQAKQFLKSFKSKLYPDAMRTLEAYINLREQPYLKQKQTLLKHQFYKQGFLRNIKLLFGSTR